MTAPAMLRAVEWVPLERVFVWFLATDAGAARRILARLDLSALPNDDWRALFERVAAVSGDLKAVADVVRDWPWGYLQFWAAAEIDSVLLLEAGEHLELLVSYYGTPRLAHVLEAIARAAAADGEDERAEPLHRAPPRRDVPRDSGFRFPHARPATASWETAA